MNLCGETLLSNSRIVVDKDDLMSFKNKENCHVLANQFQGDFRSKTLGCREIKSVMML